jgi:hypothetical protein
MSSANPREPKEPVPDFQRTLSNLTNPELLEMADEGLVLAARAKVRLGQSLSAAQHTEAHLQVVGVGEWRPTSTRPAWNAEPRLPGSEEGS